STIHSVLLVAETLLADESEQPSVKRNVLIAATVYATFTNLRFIASMKMYPKEPSQSVYASRSQFLASSSIGDERLDPFETHPPSQEVDVDHLMKHYFSSLVFNMFPYYPSPGKNPQTEYYAPLIWTDPILFNVTLQLSAFHLEKLYGRGNEQSTRLQAESIRLLRERVENNPETCSCDQTISAVAGLTAIEHAKGNMRMVQMHMDGLNRMIIVRGGLNAIRKSNAMVANIVFCMFIAADEAFPTLDLESQQETPGWYLESLPLVEQREYLDLEDCGVASEFASVMKGIRLLAQCYQTADDTDSAEHYLSVLSFLCSSMQRIVSLPPPQSEDVDVYHVTEACRSAMVVHVFSQWCGHQPDPSIMVSAAQHNLKSHLKQLLGPGANNPLFLWLLSAGAVAAVGAPERAWFVGHLAAIVDDLGIQSWVEIRDQLKRVIWHEHQDEDSHKRVWEDLEALERQS
ncbi:MAG: hypothetical protein Q9157_007027, partial [Trypethelium eluteriae]